MELVKVVQVILINNDLTMYYEETGTPAKARTSTLNEELGQVSILDMSSSCHKRSKLDWN